MLRRRLLVARLLAAALATSCSPIAEPAEPAAHAPLIELPATATADGASLTLVRVVLDPSTPIDKRSVSVATTAGAFEPGGGATATLSPDDDGVALVMLRAPTDSSVALLSATVNGRTRTTQLAFRRSWPERVDVEAESFALRAGLREELRVTAHVRRAVGAPSPGALITFTATDTAGAMLPAARFLATVVASDGTGRATARLTLADSAARGPIVVRAAALDAPAAPSGQAVVRVIAP